jgi:uncharacterized damage-inducible protein DinB
VVYDFGGRPRPPLVGDERTMADGWLDFHRATLLWKCAGLTDAQLRQRAVPTSTLSLHGLVRHLTDVERGWFRSFLGEYVEPLYAGDDDPDGDFDNVDTADVAVDLARYRTEVDALRAALASHSLDETVLDSHEIEGDTTYSLRWIYGHMVEEYVRHNGHADLIREAIDGATGE